MQSTCPPQVPAVMRSKGEKLVTDLAAAAVISQKPNKPKKTLACQKKKNPKKSDDEGEGKIRMRQGGYADVSRSPQAQCKNAEMPLDTVGVFTVSMCRVPALRTREESIVTSWRFMTALIWRLSRLDCLMLWLMLVVTLLLCILGTDPIRKSCTPR